MTPFDQDRDCMEAAKLIESWDDILVICHANPDGDALGSMLGLVRGLRSMGKRAGWYCADPAPQKFAYLFEGLEPLDFTPAHVLTVDVADQKLLGDAWEKFGDKIELAIDHHGTHKPFAPARWVCGEYAATAEMIWCLLDMMGYNPQKAHPSQEDVKTAQCIYTGVATDTGCFLFQNTTWFSHMVAASIQRIGVDVSEINRGLFETKSLAYFQAERRMLEGMELFGGGKAAMALLPQSLYAETGAREDEVDAAVGQLRQIEGVLVGVSIKEKPSGEIKASLRTNPPANASAIAQRFGGGGHAGAAGCTLDGMDMAQARLAMMRACEDYLAELEEANG